MSKKTKKRTKRYAGEDAKQLQGPSSDAPVVHRYTAVQRGTVGQWWFERKRTIKIASIATAIVLGFGWLVFEIFQIIF